MSHASHLFIIAACFCSAAFMILCRLRKGPLRPLVVWRYVVRLAGFAALLCGALGIFPLLNAMSVCACCGVICLGLSGSDWRGDRVPYEATRFPSIKPDEL